MVRKKKRGGRLSHTPRHTCCLCWFSAALARGSDVAAGDGCSCRPLFGSKPPARRGNGEPGVLWRGDEFCFNTFVAKAVDQTAAWFPKGLLKKIKILVKNGIRTHALSDQYLKLAP
jgi:hypothetical protein